MVDAYFTTRDGRWFAPTDHARGPWQADSCHAGPPTALMVRAMEGLVPVQRLTRVTVELMRPIPMHGFRVQAEVRRPGRSVTYSEAEIFDEDRFYARAYGMHLRRLERFDVSTADVAPPVFTEAIADEFPIRTATHNLPGFDQTMEVRYDPSGSLGRGGPTMAWMRSRVAIVDGETASPFQSICPLADCGNGLSYNEYLDRVLFLNTDLTISLHRDPVGDWFGSRSISHWEPNGIGLADAELFDVDGPVGRATQNLILNPAQPARVDRNGG